MSCIHASKIVPLFSRRKSPLADLLAQGEVQRGSVKKSGAMGVADGSFDRELHSSEQEQDG